MKKADKKNPTPTQGNAPRVKFHIELPLPLDEIIREDARKARRSRRAHITYLLTKLYRAGSPPCCETR